MRERERNDCFRKKQNERRHYREEMMVRSIMRNGYLCVGKTQCLALNAYRAQRVLPARMEPSSKINIPAIAALLSVLRMPVMSALTASPATSPVLPGAICESTPIWVPSEPMLPKPHRL
jgi:hypothetical protein